MEERECKIEELKGGEEGEKRSKGRGRVFYVRVMEDANVLGR